MYKRAAYWQQWNEHGRCSIDHLDSVYHDRTYGGICNTYKKGFIAEGWIGWYVKGDIEILKRGFESANEARQWVEKGLTKRLKVRNSYL